MERKTCARLLLLLTVCLWSGLTVSAQEETRVFYTFDASNGLADNSAQTIKCTKTGRMVIATIGHINFYDGESFSHVDPTEDDAFPLPKYSGHYRLYFDRHHHLWLKDKRMVTCVDLLTERFIRDVKGVIRELGMTKKVDDIFSDSKSHLWFLSGDRLYGIDDKLQLPVTPHVELQDVDVYGQTQVLLFYANGQVKSYDTKSGKALYTAPAFTNSDTLTYAASSVVYSVDSLYYQIRNGETSGVLLCFDAAKREWKRLMDTPYHLNNMVMQGDKLYVASAYGYWTYDVKTGEAHHVEKLKMGDGRMLLTDINTLAFDRQGGLWAGTEKRGLLYAKPYTSPFVCYSWDQPEARSYASLIDHTLGEPAKLPRHVNCLYRDSRGWTWTGLYTGLQMTKREGGVKRTFTRRDGLFNEMIHSVIEDDSLNIWVSSSYGISRLTIRGDSVDRIDTYYDKDNVPSESFVNGRAIKLSDGTIVMQSVDHIITFNPANFHFAEIRRMELFPKLIKLMVNGHFFSAGTQIEGKTVLDRAVTRSWDLTVNYNQNNLSLTFSGLNFIRPIQTCYRVRVSGVMNDWQVFTYFNSKGRVDSNGMLHLALFGLSPGEYKIEVQASMDPGYWPMDPIVWTITVKEPWWRSTGIYVLLGIVLLSLIMANFFYFNRNTRLRLMRNTEETDIVKRIRSYAKRCDEMTAEQLVPQVAGFLSDEQNEEELSADFVEAMMKIVPFLRGCSGQEVTMKQLTQVAGMEKNKLLEVLSADMNKSPRLLSLQLRLKQAADMVRDTFLTVEEIAERCGYLTTNQFISMFYHYYRQTPNSYRNSKAR